jgi:hypothetical protein
MRLAVAALQTGGLALLAARFFGRGCRVKAKPHAVASRVLTQRPRAEGWQLSRRPGEDQDAAISAGRTAVRRAINPGNEGSLTVTYGHAEPVIDLRPACHRKEERIRAHVILCWLALLLIRIAETTAGATWAAITDELDLLTLGTFTGPAGTFRQTAELTKTQRDLLAKLKITYPKKIIEVTPASP